MEEQASSVVIGLMVTIFGGVGLLLAAGSRDVEMTIFGLSLATFAVLFVGGLLRQRFSRLAPAVTVEGETVHD